MQLNGNQVNVEIRSEEVQEILARMPHWTLRWGTGLIFSIIVLIISASWFIKYPDKVTSQILLTTEIPPVKIISRSTGRLEFFIENEKLIREEQPLAVIKNAAVTDDILRLAEWLESKDRFIKNLNQAEDLRLGEIQFAYSNLKSAITNERLNIEIDEYRRRKRYLTERIHHFQELNEQVKSQQKLLQGELNIAERNFEASRELYEEQALAELQLDQVKNSLLQVSRQMELIKTNRINNNIQISTLKEQLLQAEVKFKEDTEVYQHAIEKAFRQLKTELSEWKRKYLLSSPIEGRTSFLKFWKNGQFVKEGEEVMTIVPKEQEVFGQVSLPINGSGKVEVGQWADLRFDNYPAKEFGIVKGRVENISLVPRDNSYFIKLSLPYGLNTSYNRELKFRQQMSGSAEIITEDLRLLERIFSQLKSLFDRI